MFTSEDKEFIDFLFDKLTSVTIDTEMIDLQDDDSCSDHLAMAHLDFEKLVES